MLMCPTGGKCSGRLGEGTEWKHCYGSEEGKTTIERMLMMNPWQKQPLLSYHGGTQCKSYMIDRQNNCWVSFEI